MPLLLMNDKIRLFDNDIREWVNGYVKLITRTRVIIYTGRVRREFCLGEIEQLLNSGMLVQTVNQ